MALSADDIDRLRLLEEQLWRPDTRFSRAFMERVLGEAFFEFGASGKRWTRGETIDAAPCAINVALPLPDFSARALTASVALVTYRSVEHQPDGSRRRAWRSSIWVRTDDDWKLEFHQGTLDQ